MGKFVFGVIVGILIIEFAPEFKKAFNESGLNDTVIESLEGLKKE